MTKQSGLGDNLYVDGYNLSGNVGSFGRIGGGNAPLDLTDITQSAYDREGGLRDGGIDWTSWFDKALLAAHPVLSVLPRTNRYVTYFRGQAIGNAAASMMSRQINYDPTRGQDGSLTFGINTVSDQYGLQWGRQLTAGVRTDTTGTNGSSVDDGASTAFGWQAFLHVFAFTGTSVTVKIQDSADNGSWADVTNGAFVAATALGAQRIAVGNTTTLRRYVRAVTTGTFTNAQFSVNLVRNEVAGQVF